jgi:hypothetical protein
MPLAALRGSGSGPDETCPPCQSESVHKGEADTFAPHRLTTDDDADWTAPIQLNVGFFLGQIFQKAA